MLTWLAVLAGAWALVVVLAWAFQDRLVHLPDTSTPVAPWGVDEVVFTTADGLDLAGWVVDHPDPVAWVVVVNGNAGNRAGRLPLAERLRDRGYAVLLFDHRGYGGNPGRPDVGGLVTDLQAAVDWLHAHVSPDRVVYLGESIGSAVAAVVARDRPPDALVLRSPFTSLADVGRRHHPYLPVRTLLRRDLDVVDAVGRLQVPTLVVAAERDRIVPAEMSRTVAEVAGAQWLEIEGVGHNDAEMFVGDEYLDAVDGFVRDAVGDGS